MAKLRKLSSRLVVFVIFVLSLTRVMVARILPWTAHAPERPSATKVFALSEAEWLQLRAIDEKNSPQQSEEKKSTPQSPDAKDEQAKSDEKKMQKPECKPKSEGQNTPAPSDDKDKSTKPACEEGPGGGDGDMGGTGG